MIQSPRDAAASPCVHPVTQRQTMPCVKQNQYHAALADREGKTSYLPSTVSIKTRSRIFDVALFNHFLRFMLSFFLHLEIGRPTEEQESTDDQNASDDGCEG